jgi:hypothetical protein
MDDQVPSFQPKPIQCAFCDSSDVKLFSLYGQTLLGSQYYCNACRSIFEVVRFEEESSGFQVQGSIDNLEPETLKP